MGSYANQLRARLKKPQPEQPAVDDTRNPGQPAMEMEKMVTPAPAPDMTPQDPYPRKRAGESPIPGTVDRRDQPGVAGGMANAIASTLLKKRFLK